jgi:hypothetical protein
MAVREVNEETGISYGLCQATLIEELEMMSFSEGHSRNADTKAKKKKLLCGFSLA